MSTVDVLEHYRWLTSRVFDEANRMADGTYDPSTLETSMKEIIKTSSNGYTGEEYMVQGSVGGTGKRYRQIIN